MDAVVITEEMRQEAADWVQKATASLSAVCRGKERYQLDELKEVAILPDEVEMLLTAYLEDIKLTLLMYYAHSQSGGSDNRREIHAWKRIATFRHNNDCSVRELSRIFWVHVVSPVDSRDNPWISVFREMADRLAEMGVTVHDYRPDDIEGLGDW